MVTRWINPKSSSLIRPTYPLSAFFWLVSAMIDPRKFPFFDRVVVRTPSREINPLMAAFFPAVSPALYA